MHCIQTATDIWLNYTNVNNAKRIYLPPSSWPFMSQLPLVLSTLVPELAQIFMGQMSILSPNRQCQTTEGNTKRWYQPAAWPDRFFIYHWIPDIKGVAFITWHSNTSTKTRKQDFDTTVMVASDGPQKNYFTLFRTGYHAITSSLYRLDALPDIKPTASKHWDNRMLICWFANNIFTPERCGQ